MNAPTGAALLRPSSVPAGDAPRPSPRPDGSPDFRLDLHEAGAPTQAAQAPRTSDARQQGSRSMSTSHRGVDAARAHAQDTPSHARTEHPAARHGQDAAARARTPGAAAHASRGHAQDGAERTPDDTTPAQADDIADPHAPRHADARTGDDATTLPDRMLALLGGAMLPTTAVTAAATTTGSAAAVTTATTPEPAAIAGGATPMSATATVDNAPGTPAASSDAAAPSASAHAAPSLLALGALLPTTGTPAATTVPAAAPSDGLAALAAALTDRASARDTDAAAPGAASPDAAGTAFAPLLARGTETLQAAARTAAVVAPSPTLAFDAGFDDGLGERVLWMANERIGHAEIRVTPDTLGPIDIRVQMDGTRVHAQFHAANADVRQSLEAGMDRLRDMLGRHGMELGDAQVGDGSTSNGHSRGTALTSAAAAASHGTGGEASLAMSVRVIHGRGLVDEYA